MCDRTCPKCGSTDHYHGHGMLGSYIVCGADGCHVLLACRADPEAANTDLTDAEVEAWAREGTWVLPGAEARDPADDQMFKRE